MGLLIGVDSGQTLLKVVVFDQDGTELGAASRRSSVHSPHPTWAERDAAQARDQLLEAIPAALAAVGVSGQDIDAVGVAGHGDGLYLIGADGEPTRDAIVSLDTRASEILAQLRAHGSVAAAVAQTGQEIFAASLAPLVRWLMSEEPAALDQTRWLLSCKDWLRLCLTGEVATDFADGNSCVATFDGLAYSEAALAAYGIETVAAKLPPMRHATDIAGGIRPDVAAVTGLRAGTPVAVGTHDVVATTLGLGAGAANEVCVVAGTFGMHQLISPTRVVSDVAQSRPWIEPDAWAVMSGSAASVSSFEWFLRTQMADVPDPISVANAEVTRALREDSRIVFHPFLYGGPRGETHGSLLGVQGWHDRRHVLRAIWEGIVFTHGSHLDALRDGRALSEIRLGGGAAKSETWSQLFADGLGCTVRTTGVSEPGALGAAMLAGVGVGAFPDVASARARCVHSGTTYVPDEAARERWRAARARFDRSVATMHELTDLFDG